jgi:uncharacterized protein YycO
VNLSNQIDSSSLEAGDVLICYSRLMIGELGCETGYCHAAICIGPEKILESDAEGVKISTIDDLLIAYDHLSVFRASGLWSASRIQRLNAYGEQQIGKKFNIRALPRIEYLRELNIETSQQQIEDHFAGLSSSVETERKSYFCSELVATAFIHVGIIDQSAAIILKPETLLPIDIARDKVFGFFSGYITKSNNYVVPEDDIFQTEP